VDKAIREMARMFMVFPRTVTTGWLLQGLHVRRT
jgi:hypothetical protein